MGKNRRTSAEITNFARLLIGICLVLAAVTGSGVAIAATVVPAVKVRASAPALDASSQLFESFVTLTNTSKTRTVTGPLAVRVGNLSRPAVSLANASGRIGRNSYILVPLPSGGLAPRQTIGSLVLRFANPSGKKFRFTVKAVTGLADPVPVAPNRIPVAHAGEDRTVAIDQAVRLDGSASVDPDGDPLRYQWSILEKPAASTAEIGEADHPHANLRIDQPGSYLLQLDVNDGAVNGVPDTVVLDTGNSRPLARAGLPQTAPPGSSLVLDGSGSADADGDTLLYHWTLPLKPKGSKARLEPPDAATPGLKLDKRGDYTARLVVGDGQRTSEPAAVSLSTGGNRPVANAGPDQTGRPLQEPVTLDGTASADADGDSLSYRWSLLHKPSGSAAILAEADQAACRLTPDVAGDYIAQLIVRDGARSRTRRQDPAGGGNGDCRRRVSRRYYQ